MKFCYRSLGLSFFLLALGSTTALAQLTFDKPKTEPNLANPYTMGSKREDVMKTAIEIFKACEFPIDEANTNIKEGKITTKFVVYTRGVTARTDLEHLAEMPASRVRNWVQGRFLLEVLSLPIDPIRTQLQITARIQGRVGDTAEETWVTGASNGNLEDEVIRGIAGQALGIDLARSSSRAQKGKRRLLNCEY
jgi:hypothetical protein